MNQKPCLCNMPLHSSMKPIKSLFETRVVFDHFFLGVEEGDKLKSSSDNLPLRHCFNTAKCVRLRSIND